MNTRIHVYTQLLILFVLTVLTYLPSFFGTFIWDDEDFVYQNTYVAQFDVPKFFTENAIAGRQKMSNYYRPVPLLAYATIHAIVGFSPFWYHTISILIHILCGFVLYAVLRLLFGGGHGAFLGSALFLIHPVQTESVTYISGLSDALYTLFTFTAIFVYIRAPTKASTPVSLFLLVLAILSKELAIVALPVITVLIIWKFSRDIRRHVPYLVGVWLIGCLYLALRLSVLQFQSISSMWMGTAYGSQIQTRLATFAHAFFVYLGLLIFPKDLYMERDNTTQIITSLWSIWTVLFVVFQAILFAVSRWIDRHRPYARGAHTLLFILFFISLVPISGVIPLNGIFYEHYLYLPMIFFWTYVVLLIAPVLKYRPVQWICVIVCVLSIGRSWARQWEWIDPIRFYNQTLSYYPNNPRILNNLGMEYATQRNYTKALEIYTRGISLNPTIPNYDYNIGNIYLEQNNYEKAEQHYLNAIRKDSNFIFSYNNLLKIYFDTGQTDKYDKVLDQAITQFPEEQYFQNLRNTPLTFPSPQ